MATSTAFALGLYHEIPDVIVVGIGVPMCRYDDWGAHRDRDFTPTVVPDDPNPTGEAPRFLQVLQTADSVRIRVLVFDGETHASGIARAYVHGLKAPFAG
jgi:hypothetical protein